MAKKRGWLVAGLFFIGIIIAFELRYYWAEPRQISSESGVLVFRTGGLTLLWIFLGVAGVAGAVSSYRFAHRMFAQSISFWKRSKAVALGLLGVTGSIAVAAGVFFLPHRQEIAVDAGSEVIIVRQPYLLREADVELIPFASITHVEYKEVLGSTANVYFRQAFVRLRLVDGEDVHLSIDGPKNQYKLAAAISKATDRPLIVIGE